MLVERSLLTGHIKNGQTKFKSAPQCSHQCDSFTRQILSATHVFLLVTISLPFGGGVGGEDLQVLTEKCKIKV